MEITLSTYQQFVLDHFGWFLASVVLVAFFVNQYLSFKALQIAKQKKLFAETSERSSHSTPTPAFGGVSIFIVLFMLLLLIIGSGFQNSIGFILASCFILFVTGLKDDLIGTSALTKFLMQLIAAFLFVLNPDFALGHLDGFLGIGLINPNWTYFIGIIFIVSLVNAFNLIDGIDGLAAAIAIISFAIFGFCFYDKSEYTYVLFCAVLIGALLSFLTFNFSSNGNKMFLGDTGSLVLGFLLAAFALRIIEIQPLKASVGNFPQNSIIFVVSVMVIPILDTLRVIIVRLRKGRKPWHPDRYHMHHVLLDFGFSHKEATLRLVGLQLVSITGYFIMEPFGNIALHLYVIVLLLSFTGLFVHLRVEGEKNNCAVELREV